MHRTNQLQRLFKQLSVADQETLLAFAEFLYERRSPTPIHSPEPLPRPAKLFDQAASLMNEHILLGRDRVAVIDELEKLFSTHYQAFVQENKQ